MKIAFVVPNVGMNPEALDQRRAFLQSHARPDTEILGFRNDDGPAAIESETERDWASVEIARHIARLSQRGDIDAFIPWCAGDPGMIAGREAVCVPVVGPMQAAAHYASTLGFRFSWIIPQGNPRLNRLRVEGYGLGGQLASVLELGTPVLELRNDLPATRAKIAELVALAAERDGADAVVLGCMALFGVAGTLDAPRPVIDPTLAALNMAQSLVAMGLTHAPETYGGTSGPVAEPIPEKV
ncbi:aspartate/glutamate racemase family protein [Salipiger mucosus]|uniref:Racemase, putative n=1 Tax=Salipiger mucosus DSM 16094 TaxID=1123237 RepID=S9QFZ9_9RHOB|nr:aspartate/glutamate racemase family protein [Salipiger mucosus]EPX80361.1 racemase, putative [Salipiger mucosus DSM 16094]